MDWSWVATPAEVEEAREHARRLIGLRLAEVRYVSLDYLRPDDSRGPRLVTGEDEWRQATWRYDFGDSVERGVEFREVPLIGEAVVAEADVAVWPVSRAGRWDRFVGPEVGGVHLAYKPWAPDDGYWCSRITVTILGCDIQLLLGEGQVDQQLHPSADNIAVLFPPSRLPDWDR